MTALDRARAFFLEPASRARDNGHADSAAVAAGSEPRPSASALHGASAGGQIASAVVLGRPGQAEPMAAAVALALGQGARPRAATVAVIAGAQPGAASHGATHRHPDSASARDKGGGCAANDAPFTAVSESHPAAGHDDPQRSTTGGTRAARRLAARLDAHGLRAHPRGRLVWVRVPGEHRQTAARRALLVGAPAVLAVTAPRTADIEELLAEHDVLVLVTADPAGPLARVAALAPGGIPVAITRPLPRGLARTLALAGLGAPKSVRELLASAALPGSADWAAA